MPDALLVEWCDFDQYPVGGQLRHAQQLAGVLGERIALVGVSTDHTPPGQWVKKQLNGLEYDFFAVGQITPSPQRTLVPARLTTYVQMRRYRKGILSLGVRNLFVQSPEVLMAIQNWGWGSICCRCPGLANPMLFARYRWAKLIAKPFFRRWMTALAKCDVVLAAADDVAIERFVAQSEGKLSKESITKFPTSVDTQVFYPTSTAEARRALCVDQTEHVIVHCGRVNAVKGWRFLVDSFSILARTIDNARLVFVGDGEDRRELLAYVSAVGLSDRVSITGYQHQHQVACWLNAADVAVIASLQEGWCTAMLEAFACGKAVVSTDVSGARDLISEGQNGYIVKRRNPAHYAEAIGAAMALRGASEASLATAQEYAMKNLATRIARLWKPLA